MELYYADFRSTGGINGSPHPRGQFRAAASLVDLVHIENAAMGSAQTRLAIAFPSLVDSSRDIAGKLRVFGDEGALTRLVARVKSAVSDAQDKLDGRLVGLAPQSDVHVAFLRDRGAEKEVAGYADRSLLRAQRKAMARVQRGDSFVKPPMDSQERLIRVDARAAQAAMSSRLHLAMHSGSTGQRFSLNIRCVEFQPTRALSEEAPGAVAGIDIYGLSKMSSPTAMPHF